MRRAVIAVSAIIVATTAVLYGYPAVTTSKSEADVVSFSEIEKTYADSDLKALQSRLTAVKSETVNAGTDKKKQAQLKREKVVLTKLIIFKKFGTL